MSSPVIPLGHANDNRLSAQFIDIPAAFLRAYSREILDWGANLQTHGRTLEIQLWNAPGATILSPGFQGRVTLCCDGVVAPETGHVLLIIQPLSEGDVANIRRHVEILPAIMQAHAAAAQRNKGTARGAVRAVFDLPEYFVERYGYELREWGRNLKSIGMVKTIVLREGTLSDLSPNEEIGAVMRGVKLKAKIERLKNDELQLLISPLTEDDERVIAKHCEKMQGVGIRARAELVEPPRPGMPFMPNVIGAAPPPADGGV